MSWIQRLLERIAPSAPPAREGLVDSMRALGPGQITWRTHCCHTERPDGLVGVMHVPIAGMEEHFPGARMNFRYCIDRPTCVAMAQAARTQGGTP